MPAIWRFAQTVDFDPHSLRDMLPAAVSRISEAARAGAAGVATAITSSSALHVCLQTKRAEQGFADVCRGGGSIRGLRSRTLPCATCVAGKRVYVHCTAGLGRAPAACIAYLYWVADDGSLREGGNWSLDKARPEAPLFSRHTLKGSRIRFQICSLLRQHEPGQGAGTGVWLTYMADVGMSKALQRDSPLTASPAAPERASPASFVSAAAQCMPKHLLRAHSPP